MGAATTHGPLQRRVFLNMASYLMGYPKMLEETENMSGVLYLHAGSVSDQYAAMDALRE